MHVLKFGGTSVGTEQGLYNISEILLNTNENTQKLVIVSAACKSTNMLEEIYMTVINNDEENFSKLLNKYNIHELNLNKKLNIEFCELNEYINKLQQVFKLSNEKDPEKLKDYILSFGELISMNRLYYFLKNRKSNKNKKITKVKSYDLGFITDSKFGNARLLKDSYNNISKNFEKMYQNYNIIITTGFIGKNDKNEITTLGRGGSDLSATLFAKALNSELIQIWSDVAGIMSSDPRYIKDTKLINKMTYNEALELSFFGAKILHPETIEPILKNDIPLYILNTF